MCAPLAKVRLFVSACPNFVEAPSPPVPQLPAAVEVVFQVTLTLPESCDATGAPALVVLRLILLTLKLPVPAVRLGLLFVISASLALLAVMATVFMPPQTGMDASAVPPFLHDKVPSMKLGEPEETLIEDDREFAPPLAAKVVGASLAAVNDHDGHLSSFVVLALPLVMVFPYISQNHAYAVWPEQLTAKGEDALLLQKSSSEGAVARVFSFVSVATVGVADFTVIEGEVAAFLPQAEMLRTCAVRVSKSLSPLSV